MHNNTLNARAGLRRLSTLLLAAATLLLPASAWAVPYVQIQSIAKSSAGDWDPPTRLGLGPNTPGSVTDIHVVNRADCFAVMAATNPKVTITWTWTPTAVVGTPSYSAVTKVAPAGKSCLETSLQETDTASACIVNAQVDYSPGTLYTFDVDLRDLIGRNATCEEGSEQDATVYILVNDTAVIGGTSQVVAFKLRFRIDLVGPAVPTVGSITQGNQNLRINWSHADETTVAGSYVYWADLPFDATAIRDGTVTVSKSPKLTAKTHQITKLTNGKKYYVAVTAVDANENESELSPLKTASPIPVYDAWQYYKNAGGEEEGGFAPCSAQPVSAGPSWLWLLLWAVAAVWAVRRRKSGLMLSILAVGLLAQAGEARAASPETGSLDFRFSRYLPQIDDDFTGSIKPYKNIFGSAAWQLSLSTDSRVWDRFGTLSLGLSAGYWSQDGYGREQTTGDSSSDTTTLSIVPITADLVYRMDELERAWGIPFIPYAKLGLVYGIWWMRDGVDNLARWTDASGNAKEAMGGTGGYHATVGMRFLLDVLEPMAARSFDIEMGVNHSYLFAEYQMLRLNDFGNKKSLNLSDDLFTFGIAFDY
ncbi:MAG: hypothetical protein HY902_10605 [Deltaproteobacteria bacterium]|nr:hypothetical protein [Deltaproteobacteria bacterium]